MTSTHHFSSVPLIICAVSTFLLTFTLRKSWSSYLSQDSSTSTVPALISSKEVEKVLHLDSLADLVQTTSFPLRGRVIRVLLEKGTLPHNLRYIANAVLQSKDSNLRLKATIVLQIITKLEDHRAILVEFQIPQIICKILLEETNEIILKECIIVLYDLIANLDELKLELVLSYNLLSALKRALTTIKNRDLATWSILLIHNLSITETTQKSVLQESFVPIIGQALRLSFGMSTLQKLCFHSLVRLIGGLEKSQSQLQLESLQSCNIIGLITNSIKQDDTELVYWALGLLHEYAVKDVFRSEFRDLPPLLPALLSLFSNQESGFTKVLLRILKFLGLRNIEFQKRLLLHNAVPQVMACLSMEDEDCQYWALTLMHDLASHPEASMAILEHPDFPNLLDFSCTQMVATVPFYIIDIISCLCASTTPTDEAIIATPLCASILKFLKNEDHELVSSALASFFNLALMSSSLLDVLLSMNALEILTHVFLYSGRRRTELMCTKLFCIIISFRPDLLSRVSELALQPFILGVLIEHSHHFFNALGISSTFPIAEPAELQENGSPNSHVSVESTLLVHTNVLEDVNPQNELTPPASQSPSDPAPFTSSISQLFLNEYKERVESALNCISFFSMYSSLIQVLALEHPDVIGIFIDSLMSIALLPFLGGQVPSNDDVQPNEMEIDSVTSPTTAHLQLRHRFSSMAIQTLSCLIFIEPIYEFLSFERFLGTVVAYFEKSEGLRNPCLGAMARLLDHLDRSSLLLIPRFLAAAWKAIYLETTSLSLFYAKLIMDFFLFDSPADSKNLNLKDATPYLLTSIDGTEIWNTTWAFESIRGAYGVTQKGAYKYEVLLLTEGLIQIGWATSDCVFDMACGRGVGDDDNSYSYDGMRERKWHGFKVHFEGWAYGKQWKIGDIIECLFNLSQGTISFTQNGINLGIAFQNVDTSLVWYPALSIASGQGCRLQFGDKGNPFLIMNDEYYPISDQFRCETDAPSSPSSVLSSTVFHSPDSTFTLMPDSPQTTSTSPGSSPDPRFSSPTNLIKLPVDPSDVIFYLELEVHSDGQLGVKSPDLEVYISFYPLQIHNANSVDAFSNERVYYGTMGIGLCNTSPTDFSVFFTMGGVLKFHFRIEPVTFLRPFFNGSGCSVNWGTSTPFKFPLLHGVHLFKQRALNYLNSYYP
ncbi:hypothetical protein HMI54_002074 [Coelomomyces lativittatus]|nr:hypothetical protein HMI54_002074 [Coelomomyces lativittatus]KAJ1512907.1 hypothetical protein HMI56_003346 [Coelomomyces lativittatus]